MNKNDTCSSSTGSGDDNNYVEIDELDTGPRVEHRADDGDDDDDDDDIYVNTKDLDVQQKSKQYADDDGDDDYVNTEKMYNLPTTKQSSVKMRKSEKKELRVHEFTSEDQNVSAHMKLKVHQSASTSSNSRLKIFMMILLLLLLGSLAALGALINLYQGKVASLHIIHEQYLSVEHEAADFKSRLDQVQVRFENLSEELNTSKVEIRNCGMKYQRVEGELLEAKVEMRKYEMKYQRGHELLSENKEICEKAWRSLGLKCYFFSNDKLNWMESRASCVKKGADLVIITSQKEQDFLSSEATETCWIGLTDQETEGKWMWVNKQTLEETGVKFWYQRTGEQSEPDNWKEDDPNGENCACLGYDVYDLDQWFDVSCTYKRKYICQK